MFIALPTLAPQQRGEEGLPCPDLLDSQMQTATRRRRVYTDARPGSFASADRRGAEAAPTFFVSRKLFTINML